MKKLLLVFVGAAILLTTYAPKPGLKNDEINPLVGDAGYIALVGEAPNASSNETLRIKSHLGWVENMLRQKSTAHLTAEEQENRRKLLDLLHTYHSSGKFPSNYDFPGERRPCFIDRNGNICAVGYLVEQTAGRNVAEAINQRFQYAYISEMKMPELDNWIKSSGLTKHELAMIQPAYETPREEIKPSYAIGSAVATTTNITLMSVNALQLDRSAGNSAGIFGLLSGAGQIVLGITNLPRERSVWGRPWINENQQKLSVFNIAAGTGTVILSTCNLLFGRKQSQQKTKVNIYTWSTPGSTNAVGVHIIRKL